MTDTTPSFVASEYPEDTSTTRIAQLLLESIRHAEAAIHLCDQHPYIPGIGSGKSMARFYVDQGIERLACALRMIE